MRQEAATRSALEMTGGDRPIFSVVIPAYNARDRIHVPLESLRRQDFRSFEVVVVDSGPRSCATQAIASFPGVRIVRSRERLFPGAARNRGLKHARGAFVAFMSDDCVATPRWLSERARLHAAGYDLVGGAIANGRPRHPVASAEYLLEYSALIPEGRILARQAPPHALSFASSVFERAGYYPEDTSTGEDTLFNLRCVQAGMGVGFAPQAVIAHHGSTGLAEMFAHAYAHGRGLAECVQTHGLEAPIHPATARTVPSAVATSVRYASRGWLQTLRRISRGAPRLLPSFLALSPLILAASLATAVGACRRYREGATSAARAVSGATSIPRT
jgi:GT2 family glycosyltransferase